MVSVIHPWLKAFYDADNQFANVSSDAILTLIDKWDALSERATKLALRLHNVSNLNLLSECKLRYGDCLRDTVLHFAEMLTEDAEAIEAGWLASYEEVNQLAVRTARLVRLKKLNAPVIIVENEAWLIADTSLDKHILCGPAERKNINDALKDLF